MGTPEFPNLGKHCFVEDCRQVDFLPFTRDCRYKSTGKRTLCWCSCLVDVGVIGIKVTFCFEFLIWVYIKGLIFLVHWEKMV
uniref:Zinc finger protein n=1 Tax=Solanum tuberosum TaxID=4113 RepID=M1B9T2_SOLTU